MLPTVKKPPAKAGGSTSKRIEEGPAT